MAQKRTALSTAPHPSVPLAYRLFFLWLEPVATLAGAYAAQLTPDAYMRMTYTSPVAAAQPGVSARESIVLTQLANLYFVFALNEALVLRATADLHVWRVLLLGLLIADFGHLYSVNSVGVAVYWQFWTWNAMYWGNLGFVYVGAAMRTCFLLGVGLPGGKSRRSKR